MNTRQRVLEMLEHFDTAMMVTHAPSGPLDCRPMYIAELEVDRGGPIWFITSAESRKVVELARNAETLLIFQDASHSLAVWGRAHVESHPDRTRRLWKDAFQAWFPGGVDDPDVRLIAVQPHSAEFWETSGAGRGRHLFGAASPLVAGARVEVRENEAHGRTNL
jgi:general stress protein 26